MALQDGQVTKLTLNRLNYKEDGFRAVAEEARADEYEGWISGIDEIALGVEKI